MKRRNFFKVGAVGLASPVILSRREKMKTNTNNQIFPLKL